VAGEEEAAAGVRQGPAVPEAEAAVATACQEAGAAVVPGLPQVGAQARRAQAAAESQEHPEAKASRARVEAESSESA
jgi:hypothetical protein